ncbi:unnamed protein product [Rhizoctonia solani]|uniref:Uncharacterized protein n=1 Tax=Rhizoctonia solani TaxID=456999 RepID=A0A8H2WS01_9AGAM|nr:unnamed protein product [Rhizoctonia solani]
MSFASSSVSVLNGSLAWSMGNGGEGRFEILFPMTLGWYEAQPSTQFRVFEHRKELTGLRHEFIVLEFNDDSICRIERMGDPRSRFDALSMDGSVARDIAQCFRSEHTEEAHLHTSEVVSRILLDSSMDLMDVLKICRAIHEAEKTRNYTLRGFNCYFFALTIQVCLIRHLAEWQRFYTPPPWLSEICGSVAMLADELQRQSREQTQQSFALLSSVSSIEELQVDELFKDIEKRLEKLLLDIGDRTKQAISSELWYTELDRIPHQILENGVRLCVLSALYNCLKTFVDESLDREAKFRGAVILNWLSMVADKLFGIDLACITTGKHKKSRPAPCLWKSWRRYILRPMDYRPPTPQIDLDRRQQVEGLTLAQWWAILWLNLPGVISWLLWLFHHILGTWGIPLMTGTSPKPCMEVIDRLEHILRSHRFEDYLDTKKPQIDILLDDLVNKYQEGAAIWDYTPWDNVLGLVKRISSPSTSLPNISFSHRDIPESPKTVFPSETQRQGGGSVVQTITCNSHIISVRDFQEHILSRIELQAKLVERVRLGSALEIQAELGRKMDEVWKLIREDDIGGFSSRLERFAARLGLLRPRRPMRVP